MKVKCLLLLVAFLGLESVLATVELSFSLTSNGPLDSTNRYINIEMRLRDEEGVAEKWARQYENEANSLDNDQKLAVCKWHLSRFQFVKAEGIAEKLVKEAGEKEPRYQLGLGVVKICRGDFAAAKDALSKAAGMGQKNAKALLLYVQVVLTDDLREAEPTVRDIVTSGEFNQLPSATAAVLAFCIKSVNSDESLFNKIVDKIDRNQLAQDEVSAKMYILLCRRYGKSEEAEKMEKILKDAKRSQTAVG